MRYNFLFIFLSFCLFVTIGQNVLYLEKLELFDSIFSISRTVLLPVVLLIVVFLHKKLEWYKLYSYICLYFIFELTSSLINEVPNILPAISFCMSLILLFSAISIGCLYDYSRTIKAIRNILAVYTILNFLLVLVFPDGIWIDTINEWTHEERGRYILGGNRNQMGSCLLCSQIAAALYYQYTSKGKVLYLLVTFCSICSLALVGSKTSTIGNMLFLLFFCINKMKNKIRFIEYFTAFYFVFQIFTVFIMIDLSEYELVRYFIEDILNKDITFSNRTAIWLRSAIMIADSPVIGWGLRDNDWYNLNIGAVSPHNLIYSILLKGGYLQLISFVIIIIHLFKNVRKYLSKKSLATYFGLWVILFMMIMEVYNIFIIGLVFSLIHIATNLSKHGYHNYSTS